MSAQEEQEYKGEGIQADQQVEDPIDAETADSDATLQADEKATMDESNIIEERTRGATKAKGTYTDPDEEAIDEDSEGNVIVKD